MANAAVPWFDPILQFQLVAREHKKGLQNDVDDDNMRNTAATDVVPYPTLAPRMMESREWYCWEALTILLETDLSPVLHCDEKKRYSLFPCGETRNYWCNGKRLHMCLLLNRLSAYDHHMRYPSFG